MASGPWFVRVPDELASFENFAKYQRPESLKTDRNEAENDRVYFDEFSKLANWGENDHVSGFNGWIRPPVDHAGVLVSMMLADIRGVSPKGGRALSRCIVDRLP